MRVEVVPYDPRWQRDFEWIRAELDEALAAIPVLTIEHVGSTSVPGLAAKPIIDVDIVVATDQIEAATDALRTIGYQPRGDLGVPDRYAFSAPSTGPERHVYLTVDGCLSLRNHLGVRQVLLEDADLRQRYGDLKLRLAANDYDDVSRYVEDKSSILHEILAAAGIPADERDGIASVNRTEDTSHHDTNATSGHGTEDICKTGGHGTDGDSIRNPEHRPRP